MPAIYGLRSVGLGGSRYKIPKRRASFLQPTIFPLLLPTFEASIHTTRHTRASNTMKPAPFFIAAFCIFAGYVAAAAATEPVCRTASTLQFPMKLNVGSDNTAFQCAGCEQKSTTTTTTMATAFEAASSTEVHAAFLA